MEPAQVSKAEEVVCQRMENLQLHRRKRRVCIWPRGQRSAPSAPAAQLLSHPHHGFRSVRKSVSVQGVKLILSSAIVACAKARERGAGPRTSFPGHDAAEVCADRVHAEVLHAVFRGHEPRGLALQPLHKLAVALLVGRQPTLDADRLSLLVLGCRAATAAASDWKE